MFLTVLAGVLLRITLIYSLEHTKYAAVIYRHGDRTPVDPYPTDPWGNQSFWPEKFGQLTNTGKSQHYAFGKWMGIRYTSLVGNKFDPTVMRIRSTDVDRTLMSAQTNLAGMFPPVAKSVWNKDLLWQPVPVHTVPAKEDELLAMEKPCYKYEQEKKRVTSSLEFKERLSKYQPLMEYLSNHTGKKVLNYEDINSIYNVLFIETLYNFTLPEWTNSVFPDKMIEPAGYSFQVDTMTPLLARLRVGPFIKEVVTNMIKVVRAHTSKRSGYELQYYNLDDAPSLKLHIYSAHDLNIASVLNALGLFDGKCPQYTSAIFMELIYDDVDQHYFVKILYRTSPNAAEPITLFIPHCGLKCPLKRFLKLYDNLISVNWEQECSEKCVRLIHTHTYKTIYNMRPPAVIGEPRPSPRALRILLEKDHRCGRNYSPNPLINYLEINFTVITCITLLSATGLLIIRWLHAARIKAVSYRRSRLIKTYNITELLQNQPV